MFVTVDGGGGRVDSLQLPPATKTPLMGGREEGMIEWIE